MMVLLFRRRACSLSPVHVQISCDSFLSDKSTCSRTRRKPSFPNASEITANINSRDADDSQRGVLTCRELAHERHFTGNRFCLTERLGISFRPPYLSPKFTEIYVVKVSHKCARVIQLHVLCPVSGQSNQGQIIQ